MTLPAIRWGVIYGIILTTARSLGEYGAVAIVSGKISGKTETLTVHVEERYLAFDLVGAYTAVDRARHARRARAHRACRSTSPGRLRRRRTADTRRRAGGHPGRLMPWPSPSRHLVKRFGDFVALDDVSLEIADGSLTALLGPSGSGKTTLLRIIGGLETPDAGHGRHRRPRRHPRAAAAAGHRLRVPALRAVQAHDRVGQRGLRADHPQATQGRRSRRRVRELLALVQIGHLADRYPSQLSGGQRQRMALARALAVEPEVLLLDEPFGALDARVRKELRIWLRRLHDETHVTTVFVTHDQEEAMDVADHIVVMDNGRIEQEGIAARAVRAPRQRVRDELHRAGQPARRPLRPAARPDPPVEPFDGSAEAMVERVVYLGFEVRVELVRTDGARVWAQVPRDESERLELAVGQIVTSLQPREGLRPCLSRTRPPDRGLRWQARRRCAGPCAGMMRAWMRPSHRVPRCRPGVRTLHPSQRCSGSMPRRGSLALTLPNA